MNPIIIRYLSDFKLYRLQIPADVFYGYPLIKGGTQAPSVWFGDYVTRQLTRSICLVGCLEGTFRPRDCLWCSLVSLFLWMKKGALLASMNFQNYYSRIAISNSGASDKETRFFCFSHVSLQAHAASEIKSAKAFDYFGKETNSREIF